MFSRLTISVILKAAIALCSAAIIALLLVNVSSSWNRLHQANRALIATRASADLFTVLHNLRFDRSMTHRDLLAAAPVSQLMPMLRNARATEMAALKSGLELLRRLDLPQQRQMVADLSQMAEKLAAVHAESNTAFLQPKSQRPPGIADTAQRQMTQLSTLVDTLSKGITAALNLQDSYIDKMMELKDLAWVARSAAGQPSVMISDGLVGRPLSSTAWDDYVALVSKADTTWAEIKGLTRNLPLPASFVSAIQKVDHDYFDPAYSSQRSKILKALIAGQPPGITIEQWSPMTVARLSTIEGVADAALDAAKEHAAAQYASAVRDLAIQLSLMAGAIVLALGMMLSLSMRVVNPLHKLSAAMRQLGDGDFSVILPGLGRKDEIGAIAAAVEGFKVKAAEKAQREATAQAEQERQLAIERNATAQRDAAAKAEQERQLALERDAAMARLSGEFESAVGSIVQAAVRGDLSRRVTLDGKSGLILNVGTAINTLCDTISSVLEELAGMLGALAAGDLTRRIESHYEGTFATLKESANTTAERISATIAEIKRASQEVASAAAEISASTTDLSQRTEEQAASLEQTSASMEQMSITVKKNAEQAKLASEFASESRDTADRSGEVVAQAVNAMSRIDKSSKKIVDIITVIDEISRQTNLLALNAAVEAARAGDAGRGFAVVASEVRSLAQRSSGAAKDINDLITSSSRQVGEGVDLVNKAGESLSGIVKSIKKVAAIVSDIATASAEQSTGIGHVNKALSQVDEVTQQNSALVEENAATAKALEDQAATMNKLMEAFRLRDMRVARSVGSAASAEAYAVGNARRKLVAI